MKIGGFEFLVGADPELFIVNAKGKLVSAHGMVPGTKDEPFKVRNGAVQVDGLAAEFNIKPAATERAFKTNLTAVQNQLTAMLPKGHKLVAVPTAHFGKEFLAKQPKEALELGCDPDYNAYTGKVNPRPDGAAVDFRTGAGHIHIGWCSGVDPKLQEHYEACCFIAKELDARVGVLSLLWDDDAKRRVLYGKAGAFRPKPYGMEYRTPSNAWLNSPKLVGFVYKQVIESIKACVTGISLMHKAYDAKAIINGNDVDYARDIALYFNIEVPDVRK